MDTPEPGRPRFQASPAPASTFMLSGLRSSDCSAGSLSFVGHELSALRKPKNLLHLSRSFMLLSLARDNCLHEFKHLKSTVHDMATAEV